MIEPLRHEGVRTFVSTRKGGVSTGAFASLNLSFSVGDSKENVIENRRRLAKAVGVEPTHLVSARQVHGAAVWDVRPDDLTPRHADILVTSQRGLALLILTADCVPLVLYDPLRHVIAAVHAGWRGTVAGATRVAVNYLVERYRCSVKDVWVGVGPAIAQENYEVGPEVVAAIEREFAHASALLQATKNGHAKLDLVAANRQQLLDVGVGADQIQQLNLDTYSQPEQFYSARRQKTFGCFGTGIVLR